jgi:hypothetical protein
MNLQNPVSLSAGSVRYPHTVVILGVDINSDLVPWDIFMRKNANQMSCNRPAVLPARLRRQFLRAPVQLCRGDLRVFAKIPFAAGERLLDGAAQLAFQCIFVLQRASAQSRCSMGKQITAQVLQRPKCAMKTAFPNKCSLAVDTTIAPLESAGTSSFSTLNA